MKLWAFDDAHEWGRNLTAIARKEGVDAELFVDPRKPDTGFVFMHMHHHPQVRDIHKAAMGHLSMNPKLTLVPDYRSSVLYDDKVEQSKQLAKWMPRTYIFNTPGAAYRFLEAIPNNGMTYPFISKTSEGASSHNVRLIENYTQAREEIRFAFSDLGIKTRYGQTQRGYLLWQRFVPGNNGDIRIIAIGDLRLILKRGNRDNVPFASGSGKLQPIKGPLSDDIASALDKANEFFEAERFQWCGIDLVYDWDALKWVVLETTVGWTLHGYYECAFYIEIGGEWVPYSDANGVPVNGDRVWWALVKQLEAGVFS